VNIKALSGYLSVLTLSFVLHATKPASSVYYGSLPALMLIFPVIAGHRVKINFSLKGLLLGLIASAVLLLPYHLLLGGNIKSVTAYYVIFQLLSVSLPEEFFFRGFLQDSMGRNLKAILLASLLFAIAHLPKAVFSGEWISLFSFLPSLVMGWLYTKTNNILPGTIFHLLANLVYQTSIFNK
jgi:membrane protease YdiL (CAAX protease family)